ncbi:MAG: flap endonuclease-1 [Candidatus Altiarchaeota archaeon]
MGVNLRDIIPHQDITFDDLKGKTIAVDALNTIYQFLSSIRQPDGTPLMDSNGRVTSHLTGLLYRTANLLRLGVKPVYVFDGEPPELKKTTLRERRMAKEKAMGEMEAAKREGRMDDALKYAKRTSKVTGEMLEESKNLLCHMGIPFIQAPGEGEAQCVYLCVKGEAWAVGSQDYDALLFGAPRLVKGLTMSGKLELSLVDLKDSLSSLGLTREQLIDVAILVGTDFDPGVKGIGPKKALKAVKEDAMGELEFDFDIDEVREIFLNPPVVEDYSLEWGSIDEESLVELLCGRHDFSENRVRKAVSDVRNSFKDFSQKTLDSWFT